MQTNGEKADFDCRALCKQDDCEPGKTRKVVTKHTLCPCMGQVNISPIFLDNVLKMANTLTEVMMLCGLHECKAKSTVDLVVDSFLHYDEICDCLETTPKKRVRRSRLVGELGKQCLLNFVEINLVCYIVESAFKAFYYKRNDKKHYETIGRQTCPEWCAYIHAAKKIAEHYARYDGLSCVEQRGLEAKLIGVFKKYYKSSNRIEHLKDTSCKCCFCIRKFGLVDQNTITPVVEEVYATANYMQNVLDLVDTLVGVMTAVGIHECKAKCAIDVITDVFLHYDCVSLCEESKPKKRLRKEDLFHELGKTSLMTRNEAHLAYTIINSSFKAFYYRPRETDRNHLDPNRPSFIQESVYSHAIKKIISFAIQQNPLNNIDESKLKRKIQLLFKNYYEKVGARETKPNEDGECQCCFCTKKHGHLIYATQPPCAKEAPTKKRICPECCKIIEERKKRPPKPKCPKCHQAKKFCVCERSRIRLEWVQSIWNRPDMQEYYQIQIVEGSKVIEPECPETDRDNISLLRSQSESSLHRIKPDVKDVPIATSDTDLKALLQEAFPG